MAPLPLDDVKADDAAPYSDATKGGTAGTAAAATAKAKAARPWDKPCTYTTGSAQTRIFKVVSFLVFLLYPGLSVRLFSWFKCHEVDGTFYLVADYRIKCFEGDWTGYYLPIVLLFIGVYVVGVPVGLVWLLRVLPPDVGKWNVQLFIPGGSSRRLGYALNRNTML